MIIKHIELLIMLVLMTSTVFANECQSNKDCESTETCEISSYERCTTDATGVDICVTEVESRCVPTPIFCDDDYTCDAPHLACIESRGPYGRIAQNPDENEVEELIVPCEGEPGCEESIFECRFHPFDCHTDDDCDENFTCAGNVDIEDICEDEETCPESEELELLSLGACMPVAVPCSHSNAVCPDYWSCQIIADWVNCNRLERNDDDCEPINKTICVPDAVYPYDLIDDAEDESGFQMRGEDPTYVEVEAGAEAGVEAGVEAGTEAGVEAGTEAGTEVNDDSDTWDVIDSERMEDTNPETNQDMGTQIEIEISPETEKQTNESDAKQSNDGCNTSTHKNSSLLFIILMCLSVCRVNEERC